MRNFNLQANLCGWTGRFKPYLIIKPESRFSPNEGHLKHTKRKILSLQPDQVQRIARISTNYIYCTVQVAKCRSGLKVIKLFSCSTQLSAKFQLLIKNTMQTNKEVACFKSLRCSIYHADKSRAQLSWAWKKFYNLGAGYCMYAQTDLPICCQQIAKIFLDMAQEKLLRLS